MEKINAFLNWWHSVFGSWDPNRSSWVRYLFTFWFFDEDQMQRVPMAVSWLMLGVVCCSLLSILISVFFYKGGNLMFKIFSVPLCFLGLIGLRLFDDMTLTLCNDTWPTVVSIFTELIPGLFNQPNIGAFLMELFSIILAIPLGLFSILLHGGLALLGLTPFLVLIVMDIIIYKWLAPLEILADIGGGIILVVALALLVLGAGMVAAPMLLLGMCPILGQAIREWNFIGGGGTIIRE